MRLCKESKVVVMLRPGARAFMDTEVPFPKAWCDEITKRQAEWEEVAAYITQVHQYQRQGGDWKLIEGVPECLREAEAKAEQPAAQPDEQATAATSSKKSATSLAAERRLSMSRGRSST